MYPYLSRPEMADIVNLRTARKQAKRRQQDVEAQANRLVHGQRKSTRALQMAQQAKAARDLDRRRIEKGDGR